MFASRLFCSGTALRGLPKGVSPLRQTVRNYASQTQGGPLGSNKSIFLYSSVAAVGTGLVYYFGFKDKGVTEKAKDLPPATPVFTDGNKWIGLKLIEIETLTPDTGRFRFAYPEGESNVSGLKVASCLLTKYKGPNDAKPTIRPYTPVSDENARGYLDLIVKKYPGGAMSEHIHGLSVDQQLDFKGPFLKYEWAPNKHEHIALVAGGTGITPMWQLIRAILNNPEDKTKITLVYGNRSEDDVILKKELQHLENTYPQRFKTYYLLDKKPQGVAWASEGYVTKNLLKTVLPEPGAGNNKIFVCGPPGMYKAVSGNKVSPKDQGELEGYLKELGYSKEDVYKF